MLQRVALYYLQSLRTYRYSHADLAALQGRKLRRIVLQAYRNVPYYSRRFREQGIDPESVRGVEDITKLPTMTKADMVSNFPGQIVASNVRTARYRYGTGTTGKPIVIALSEEEADVRSVLNFRRMAKLGVRPWNRVATVWAPDQYRRLPRRDRPASGSIFYSLPLVNFRGRPVPGLRIIRSTAGDPERDVRVLHAFRPDYIVGKPSNLRKLGRLSEELGLVFQAKGLSCAGEIVTDSCIADLERLYNSRFFNSYGSSEFGATGFECTAHMGTHLSEDYVLVEVLRGEEPAAPGESGELVMTHLHNMVMPLIRYRTGDMVRVSEGGTCGCGSNLIRLLRFEGRIGDGLVRSDGSRLPPLEVADEIESRLGLREFQVTQTGLTDFQVRLNLADIENEATIAKLQSLIEEAVGSPVRLSLSVQTEAELWAKSRPVASRVAQP